MNKNPLGLDASFLKFIVFKELTQKFLTQPSINVTSLRFGDCFVLNLLTHSTIVRKNIYNDRSVKIGLETIQSSPHFYL